MNATVKACRSCAGDVIWAITINGKPIPIDAAPVAHGNIELEERPDGKIVAHVRSGNVLNAMGVSERFVSHFATCREAGSWRGSRR
jgi:hypothetical protein